MALQIRRGTAAQRTSVTPAEGELLYTTDTKLVYVGDGATAGGNILSGGGGLANIVEDTTPQLGGNLDINGFQIVSSGNSNIAIVADGTGGVTLGPTVTIGSNALGINGNLTILQNAFQSSGFTYAQHHSTADAGNFQFYRTRGSGTAPTAVVNGDDIIDITFLGHDGTTAFSAGAMTVSIDGAVSTGIVPGRIRFFLHDGVTSGAGGVKTRLEIVKDGTIKFDSIGELTTSSDISVKSNLRLLGQTDLRFSDADSSNWVAFQAPASISTNITWTLPDADGGPGNVLTTDGSGTLSWSTGGGLANIVEDTTPQLGGPLDTNNHAITGPNNQNILIQPTGTGSTVIASSLNVGSASLGLNGTLAINQNVYSSAGFTYAQHHSTVDASNFQIYRTRGTGASPTAVLNGDDIIDMTFLGHDGTTAFTTAAINVSVDGAVSTGIVPGRMRFVLHDGVTSGAGGVRTRLELLKDGTVRFDKLSSLTSTSISIPTNNTIDIGDVQLSSNGISTINSNANLYITASSAGRVYLDNLAWPAGDGSVNQVLTTNGAGSLYWSTPGAGTGLGSRSTAFATTGSLADAATGNITITGYKAYALLKLETSAAAWVRVYTSVAARVADATRAEGVDPAPGAGVLAEVVTTGAQTILMSPGLFGWNDETVPTTSIELAVTNKSGSTTTITVTLTLVQLES